MKYYLAQLSFLCEMYTLVRTLLTVRHSAFRKVHFSFLLSPGVLCDKNKSSCHHEEKGPLVTNDVEFGPGEKVENLK